MQCSSTVRVLLMLAASIMTFIQAEPGLYWLCQNHTVMSMLYYSFVVNSMVDLCQGHVIAHCAMPSWPLSFVFCVSHLEPQ